MSPILLLTALILVPLIAYWVARRKAPRYVFSISGAAFGAIVAPLGLGLYSWFYASVFGVIPGIAGFVLAIVHEPPGFHLGIALGLVRGVEVASNPTQHAIVEAINAIVWSICYGLLGYALDYIRNKKKNRLAH